MKSKAINYTLISLCVLFLFSLIIYLTGGYSLFRLLGSKAVNYIVFTYTHSYIYIIILFLTTIACFLYEWVDKGWGNSSLKIIFNHPGKSIQNDLVSYLLVLTQIHTIIGYGFSLGIAHFFPGFIRQIVDFKLLSRIPFPLLQFFIVFILIDFLDYWFHRFEHRFSFLWMTHKFHHSSDEFTFISAKRVHPFNDASLKRMFFAIPLVMIGTPIKTYLAFEVLRQILSLFQHSNYNWNWGILGKYIFISPQAHRVHHSTEEYHFNSNYGTIFIWWDILFKTYYRGEVAVKRIGVNDCDHNQKGYIENIFTTYFQLWRTLIVSMKNKIKLTNIFR